jgi:Spy/CpxP family protein refolding chaperone
MFAIILGATAVAQTSSPASGQQAQPSAQTAPSANQTPASGSSGAQAGSNASGGQASAQQGGKGPDIDAELQLTEDQKQKIAAVVDDENKQIGAVRDDNSLNLEQKQQKVMQIRQAGTPKIKEILTPEQLQKLAAIQQRMREQQGQNPAPAQPQR